MGVTKNVTVICDYPECRGGKNGPHVLNWCETDVENGRVSPPEDSKYLVLISHNGVLKSFCGQLHAALYFLPPGYEVKQKQVVPFPTRGEFGTEPVAQADGSPEGEGA